MPTSHQAYPHTRLEGLFDHANLLRRGLAPTTLNRRDDLNAIRFMYFLLLVNLPFIQKLQTRLPRSSVGYMFDDPVGGMETVS